MTDMFGSTVDETQGRKEFKKTEYLALKPGKYTIRILDAMETKKYGHYFQGRGWVECLGDTCPICELNKKLMYEYPEDYRDQKGWNARRARYFLNVLDQSDKKVKVLSVGPQLIEDLKVMSQSIRNEEDERIDIRTYDWDLIVKGEGREKETTPSHKFFGKMTDVDLNGQELYDLSNCLIKLTAEEMLDVHNGASLKDVFALRKAKKETAKATETSVSAEIKADIEASIDDIFKTG